MSWKQLVNQLVTNYENQDGVAYVTVRERDGCTEIVNTLKRVMVIDGCDLSRKAVRRWLWEVKDTRQLKRVGAVLWAFYDKVDNKTFIGIGAYVRAGVGDKMLDRDPSFAYTTVSFDLVHELVES